ncbi:MAG: UvrD-helicase domain-containing protein [Trueperaceae bacterium]|nr:UvrD-helicase domain-containing protein [Trueperaceae bacterium]
MHLEGPALVVAGAGSGKTKTVVHRIAYLLREHDVVPQQVLAVTFTNKAAGELKERVEALIGHPGRDLWVATFHGACLRVLRSFGEHVGLASGFGIYDDGDQLDLLKEILGSVRGLEEANPRALRGVIDRAKSNLMTPQRFAAEGERVLGNAVSGMPIELVSEVFERYESRLRRANAVDFNDILGRTVELFTLAPDVLDRVQQRTVFIHVDEYQDTNAAQYELTRLLAEKYRNLMAVGDPDQSIYGFRGADIRNILDFQRDYEDAHIYRLEVNYRSVGSVLGVANALIRHNQGRLEKDLRPAKGEGVPVQKFFANDHRAEADFVARTVERFKGEGKSYADCAILYRTNAQSRVMEEALRRAGISATIVGGVGFYDRREVKDVLSYARAALNAADDVSWHRILNRPKRGIGKTSEDALTAWSQRNGVPFAQALRSADEIIAGTGAAKRVRDFLELMDDLAEAAETLAATQFLKSVIDSSGYLQALKDEGSHEALGRLENLDELVSAVAEWEEGSGGGIATFLDEAALMSSVDDRAVAAVNEVVEDDAVTLMTLHNAKGLEYPIVFLVGLEEQLIPHRSATGSLQEIEEERRLLYVGITRAQERLFMVHCGSRMSFGRTEFARASRFLEDLPKDALEEVDVLGQVLGSPARGRSPSRSTWTPATSPPAREGEAGATYRGGEKVTHPKFGAGTVVGVSGAGAKAEVTVVFAAAGAKRLLVRFAHLERV